MTRSFYILFLLIIGLLIPPTKGTAFVELSSQIESTKCSLNSSYLGHHQCCKDKSRNKDKEERKCSNKCNDNSCNCPTQTLGTVIPVTFEFVYTSFFIRNKLFGKSNNKTSSGYYSIWQPPKVN